MNTELATTERKKYTRQDDSYLRVNGAKLRAVRKALGITMKAAAERSGAASNTHLWHYEKNGMRVPSSVVKKLCEIYGIEQESILA